MRERDREAPEPVVAAPAPVMAAADAPARASEEERQPREPMPTGPGLPAVTAPVLQILRAGSLRDVDPARLVAEAHHAGVTGRLSSLEPTAAGAPRHPHYAPASAGLRPILAQTPPRAAS